jgi:hypothetical protein
LRTPQEIEILPLSINLDLTFKSNVEGTLANFREAIYTNALNFAGNYDSEFDYKYNYMVKYEGALYICIKECTGIAPGDTEYWDKVTDRGEGLKWAGAYSDTTEYKIMDMVSYDNALYACIAACTGVLPTDTNNWTHVARNGADGVDGTDGLSITWRGAYSAVVTYGINDAVSYGGSSYICILESTNNVPTNTTYWNILAAKGLDGEGVGDMLKSVYDADNDGRIDELVSHEAETTTSATQPHGLAKNKLDATTAPTANDDSADGYSVNSMWIDATNDKAYICLDATEGAAEWKDITSESYEEGTWTPKVEGTTVAGSHTYNSRGGSYYKIGKRAIVDGYVSMTKDSQASGNMKVTELPFAISGNKGFGSISILSKYTLPTGYSFGLAAFGDVNYFTIQAIGPSSSAITMENMTSPVDIRFGLIYEIYES